MGERRDLVEAVAQAALGFEELRSGQAEAAEALLAGRDTLAVMSTGSGKSAIYQMAGSLIPGTTVVVSPLIALQHDQVKAIGGKFGGAVQVNSSMSRGDRREALEALGNGHGDNRAEGSDGGSAESSVEFVFLAPEQLANDATAAMIASARPSLFV